MGNLCDGFKEVPGFTFYRRNRSTLNQFPWIFPRTIKQASYTCSNYILATGLLSITLFLHLFSPEVVLTSWEKAKIFPVPQPLQFLWHRSRILVLKRTFKVLTSSPGRPNLQKDFSLNLREKISSLRLRKFFPTQPGIRQKSKQSFWLPVGYWFSLSATAFSSSSWHPLQKWNMRFEKLKILKVTGYSGIMGYMRIPAERGLMEHTLALQGSSRGLLDCGEDWDKL